MQITFKFKIMRYLIPILLLLSACAEEQTISDPYDASRIVGTWRSMVPANPDWVYQFDGQGFMRQTFHFGGATLSSLEYPYATRQDTVFIGGDANDPARTWMVRFECDSILEVRNVTPGTLILGQFWLRRVRE